MNKGNRLKMVKRQSEINLERMVQEEKVGFDSEYVLGQ